MFQLHQHRPDQLHQGVNINIRQEQQNIKTSKQRKEKTKVSMIKLSLVFILFDIS